MGGKFEVAHIQFAFAYFCKKTVLWRKYCSKYPRRQDLDMLLALFRRLNIQIIQKDGRKVEARSEDDVALIVAGLPSRKDFESFVQEFEESRRDNPLTDN